MHKIEGNEIANRKFSVDKHKRRKFLHSIGEEMYVEGFIFCITFEWHM